MAALRYRAQFWAKNLGRVDVKFRLETWTADIHAADIVRRAREAFNAKWPLGDDPIHLVGIKDTFTGQRWGETGSKPRGGIS